MTVLTTLNVLVLSVIFVSGEDASTHDTDSMTGLMIQEASAGNERAEEFQLGHGYSRRGSHISFKGQRIDQAGKETLKDFVKTMERPLVLAHNVDAASFVALSEEYAKDKNNVYYKWISPGRFWVVTIPGADPSTFEVMDFNLAKDATRVWRTDMQVQGVEAASVRVINPGWVWKDRSSVYYQFTRLAGVDPESFRHLGQAFYRGANHVYWSSTRLEGAEVNTFRTFGNDTPYAADQRHVWFGDTRMPGIDPESFRLLHNHVFADKQGVYVTGRALPIIDADTTTFRKVAELNAGGWGCVLFRDAARAYIFDPYYNEVYTITQHGDAAAILKPVWFAEADGTVLHVATVTTKWKDGVLSKPTLEIRKGGENKPKPTWEVGKMQRMSDIIIETMALLGKGPVAAAEGDDKPLRQRGDL